MNHHHQKNTAATQLSAAKHAVFTANPVATDNITVILDRVKLAAAILHANTNELFLLSRTEELNDDVYHAIRALHEPLNEVVNSFNEFTEDMELAALNALEAAVVSEGIEKLIAARAAFLPEVAGDDTTAVS